MDIGAWLAGTADRARPDSPSDDHIPDLFRPGPHTPSRSGRRYRHKRERASSDSSIIAPGRYNHRHAPASFAPESSDHVRDAGADIASSQDSGSSGSASRKDPPAKSYERRARHKTKHDRYEPKAKKQRKERETRKDSNSKQNRRKSRRGGDGSRTAGLVQSFQLKNGPKNRRLTLPQTSTGGLFKHGRSSVQMTGRGGGLPDLAFNEMKFLQRPQEHQDEQQEAEAHIYPRKKARKQSEQEEISAYFNAQKNAPKTDHIEHASNQNRRSDRGHVDHTKNDRQEKQRSGYPTIVDLPERPFLGFGSKGGQQEHADSRSKADHTTYYSWSESAPRDSRHPPPKQPLAVPVCDVGQLSAKPLPSKPRHSDKRGRYDDAARKTQDADSRGDWTQTRRARGSALVKTYKPRAVSKPPDNTSPTRTTLQSLPGNPNRQTERSRDKSYDVGDRMAADQNDYHTSDILKVEAHRQIPDQLSYDHGRYQDKENHDPSSSFPLDDVLNSVKEAMSKPITYERRPPQPRHEVREAARVGLNSAVRRFPNAPYAHETPPYQLEQSRQNVPAEGWHGQREYQRSAAKGHRLAMEMGRLSPLRRGEIQPYEDEEMLDDHPIPESPSFQANYEYANDLQAEPFAYGAVGTPCSGTLGTDTYPFEEDARHQFSAKGSEAPPPVRGLSIEREFQNEQTLLASRNQEVVEDEMIGFWKPNKLY